MMCVIIVMMFYRHRALHEALINVIWCFKGDDLYSQTKLRHPLTPHKDKPEGGPAIPTWACQGLTGRTQVNLGAIKKRSMAIFD